MRTSLDLKIGPISARALAMALLTTLRPSLRCQRSCMASRRSSVAGSAPMLTARATISIGVAGTTGRLAGSASIRWSLLVQLAANVAHAAFDLQVDVVAQAIEHVEQFAEEGVLGG